MTSAALLTSRRFTDFDTSVIYHVLYLVFAPFHGKIDLRI